MNPNILIPMSPNVLFVAGLALSTAILSGLFFVFSNFAMKAFSNLPTGSGVSAMQSINRSILNPGFFGLFFGTASGSLMVLIIALRHWEHPASSWIVTGALLCLIGYFLVTVVFNAPLNNQLDKVDATASKAEEAWTDYLNHWQFWNRVRMIATFLAAASFAMGALKMTAT